MLEGVWMGDRSVHKCNGFHFIDEIRSLVKKHETVDVRRMDGKAKYEIVIHTSFSIRILRFFQSKLYLLFPCYTLSPIPSITIINIK